MSIIEQLPPGTIRIGLECMESHRYCCDFVSPIYTKHSFVELTVHALTVYHCKTSDHPTGITRLSFPQNLSETTSLDLSCIVKGVMCIQTAVKLMVGSITLRHSSVPPLQDNQLPESHCNLVKPPNNALTFCGVLQAHDISYFPVPYAPCFWCSQKTLHCTVHSRQWLLTSHSCCCGVSLEGFPNNFSPDPSP